MFIYIHKYMYKMYNVKVLGNPFDDNFGPFLLNLFWHSPGVTAYDRFDCIRQFGLVVSE